MKDVDISSTGKSAPTLKSIEGKKKKHQTLTLQKRSLASISGFSGISPQQPATTSDDAELQNLLHLKVANTITPLTNMANTNNSNKSIATSSLVIEKSVPHCEMLKAESDTHEQPILALFVVRGVLEKWKCVLEKSLNF